MWNSSIFCLSHLIIQSIVESFLHLITLIRLTNFDLPLVYIKIFIQNFAANINKLCILLHIFIHFMKINLFSLGLTTKRIQINICYIRIRQPLKVHFHIPSMSFEAIAVVARIETRSVAELGGDSYFQISRFHSEFEFSLFFHEAQIGIANAHKIEA